MPGTNEKTFNETLSADDLISGVTNHGYLMPIIDKTLQGLVDTLNDIKTPYAIKAVFFGDGRFNAILEIDKKARKIKKKTKKKQK